MDKEEQLLRSFEKIQLNNEIAQLEFNLSKQTEVNKQLSNKSKEMIAELVKTNSILLHEKSSLENQINLLQNSMNKIPKFILRFFLRKDIKLLDKGNTYE